MLTLQNLSIHFRLPHGDLFHAVKGVSFDLQAGETLGLVGESGSGKSVTALAILQLLSPNAVCSGSIRFHDAELLGASDTTLHAIRGKRISMIFQEPMTALNPLHTVEKQICENIRLHQKVTPQQARDKALLLLQQVGIPDAAEKLLSYPHQLSGGQRQRVMIAMALANDPEILIADEPTTALDVTVQKQILELLARLQRERGMAMLLITHDLGIVRHMARRVVVMRRGEVVEHGETEQIFTAPQHDYTKMLMAAAPSGQPAPVRADAPTVLEGEQIKVHFPIKRGLLQRVTGHVKAVDGVNLRLRAGETLGIVGESGSGKSTLGYGILQLVASQGDLLFDGQDPRKLDKKSLCALRREMQIVFQDPMASLSPRQTVADIVAEGLTVHEKHLSPAERDRMVCDILAEVGMDTETRHRYPHEFSGGQRQRIAIARAMILRPKLVILDEPTSALDVSVQKQVIELLRALQAKYQLAYMFISHDLRVVRAMAHEVIVMRAGKVVESGPAARIFTAPRQDYTRDLLSAALSTNPSASPLLQ